MHVSLECTLLFRSAFKIDRKEVFQLSKMFVSDIGIIKWKENILYIALEVEGK
jgi:hypothetical protein